MFCSFAATTSGLSALIAVETTTASASASLTWQASCPINTKAPSPAKRAETRPAFKSEPLTL